MGVEKLIQRLAVALLLRESLRLGETLHPEKGALALRAALKLIKVLFSAA